MIRFRYDYNAMDLCRFYNFFRRREIVVSKAVGKLVKRVRNVSESWPRLAEKELIALLWYATFPDVCERVPTRPNSVRKDWGFMIVA